MLYLDNNNNIIYTNDPDTIAINSCFQELKLWLGENQLNIESGVDYNAIFNQEAFLKVELQKILNKHIGNFKYIELGEPEMSNDGILTITINFYLYNNTIQSKSINLDI